jgi:hypothetical protein
MVSQSQRRRAADHSRDAAGAQRRVAPMMFVAAACLLLGLWAGLARIGWDLPEADASLMLRHGGLMVVGFVATVIAVERAVAVRSLPAFAAPALSAAAGVTLIAGLSGDLPPALATAAAFAYSLNVATLLQRHRQAPMAVSLAGGVSLAIAGLVWLDGAGFRQVVPWWMAFVVLTIAAERLEIIRFQRFTVASVLTGGALLVLVLAGTAVTLWDVGAGSGLMGIAFVGVPLWFVQRDIARRTVRTDGLARFAAVGVLAAYAWLAVSGVMLVAWRLEPGLHYDAVVHSFFIGFVFTAIIAHEPIIAPAVTGLPFAYTPLLYLPLLLLDGALLTRLAADLGEWPDVRRWSGMVQAVAISLFLALSVASIALGRMSAARGRALPASDSLSTGGAA